MWAGYVGAVDDSLLMYLGTSCNALGSSLERGLISSFLVWDRGARDEFLAFFLDSNDLNRFQIQNSRQILVGIIAEMRRSGDVSGQDPEMVCILLRKLCLRLFVQ